MFYYSNISFYGAGKRMFDLCSKNALKQFEKVVKTFNDIHLPYSVCVSSAQIYMYA